MDAACIFDHPPLSATQFETLRYGMPPLLRDDGIVFTEQLFDIKPLEIPLDAVKSVIGGCSHPSRFKRPTIFMEMLQRVVDNPESCTIVSAAQDNKFAFPKEVFAQALSGVAVRIHT